MNKSKERNEILLPRANKQSYSSVKTKTLRNSKSGVVIAQSKLEKSKGSNHNNYRKTTLHYGPKIMEESNHSKGKAQSKYLKGSKIMEDQRLTKRLMSASTDPKNMLHTLRSTSPSLEIIATKLEMKKS